MKKNFIECAIEQVIKQLYEEPNNLIILDSTIMIEINNQRLNDIAETYHHAGERAIAFRFGLYLEKILSSFLEKNVLSIDMEYNRHNYKEKVTPRFESGIEPDLIIHRRGVDTNNFLVVEFKTWWNKDLTDKKDRSLTLLARDYKKLEDLTSSQNNNEEKYQYTYGLSIVFEKTVKECINSLKWFPN